MTKSDKEISTFLSLVLRHKPEAIGLTLDPEGWANVDALIAGADVPLDRETLHRIVTTSDKQRFALSADGRSIRANQGHSVAVSLGLQPLAPPERLYHGTASRFLEAIMQQGLRPGNRQHVHLSAEADTARTVGRRHGKPAVLIVATGPLHRQGQPFFQAANGVWLTGAVPAGALSLMDGDV